MKQTCATSMAVLLFTTAAPCLLALTAPAIADDIPESMRIEQKAEKDYAKKPVVPINRGNAHHRNLGLPSEDDLPADPGAGGASDTPQLAPVPPIPSDKTTK
ncbi:hypothetical protein [Hyphomicrobium sp.]|jgi:hypothetical protein|uniref:hypothetical protein n=1 Tax=Hyphomicrobium sp. TaxID=82 RepID=UPI002BF27886|nr:hypothetical protein [Hyphomicrobium sp.]HVZ05177.1 hypothetical protein [Hyphomicrobium sp.]